MTRTQADAPAADRAAVVRQDLQNVLHPILPHRQLEAEPLVIVEGRGSTVGDADGTESLDAMAGLWCVNTGYGRTTKNTEATIQGEGPDTVATLLVEPIMSAVGVAVPPDEYLPESLPSPRSMGACCTSTRLSTASAGRARCLPISIMVCSRTSSPSPRGS